MSVKIGSYSDELVEKFKGEAERICGALGNDVTIEHVGSSAVGIGGKNIVDILVGVSSEDQLLAARDALAEIGYREGHDSHPDRIFVAFRADDDGTDRETGEGDFHIHICVEGSETYLDFLRLRDYLKSDRAVAEEYEKMKHEFARAAGYDRKKYKALKSEYVSKLIEKAKEKMADERLEESIVEAKEERED